MIFQAASAESQRDIAWDSALRAVSYGSEDLQNAHLQAAVQGPQRFEISVTGGRSVADVVIGREEKREELN